MPPTDGITPPGVEPPWQQPCWPYTLFSFLWTLQLTSLTGILLTCLLLPVANGSDGGDTGDHIQFAVAVVYTSLATTLCLALTIAEPAVYALGWMGVRGYASSQAIKLTVSLATVGFALQTVFLRRRLGFGPGLRELVVGLGVAVVVVASFSAALAVVVVLYRRRLAEEEEEFHEAGVTEPLLGREEEL